MPYDWSTRWPGVFERHADLCPFSDGDMCTCGPLGYIASIEEPATGTRVSSPMLDTLEEARAWRREQEWAVAPRAAAASNGTGNGSAPPTRSLRPRPDEHVPEGVVAQVGREARRRAAAGGVGPEAPPSRATPPARPRRSRFDDAGPARDEMPVSALIEKFLDAAEDGEARGPDGRPYSDDQLAELEWALSGYVGSHFGDLSATAVRGRHVFKLIDELEDAAMPPSRLHAVVDALRELFDYAADLNMIRVNPATYVSTPAEGRAPRRRVVDTIQTRVARPRGEAAAPTAPVAENMISERMIWT